MTNDEERWRVHPFFVDLAISSWGRVKSLKTGQLRKTPAGKRGYPVISYTRDGKTRLLTVHRLVAQAFLPNPEELPQVNHIDGDKTNNHLSNLEWVSARDNMLHARRTGLHKSDGDKAVLQIYGDKIVAMYKSASEAARCTGARRAQIGCVCRAVGTSLEAHYRTAGGFKWRFADETRIR